MAARYYVQANNVMTGAMENVFAQDLCILQPFTRDQAKAIAEALNTAYEEGRRPWLEHKAKETIAKHIRHTVINCLVDMKPEDIFPPLALDKRYVDVLGNNNRDIEDRS